MTELRRILYVDDETDIQEIARLALEHVGGFEVRVCDSGEQALLEAASFNPDMILLDVMMPGIDGPTTLARLREDPALSRTPVVFMTAKVQPSEVQHYNSLGARGVIAKPFEPMTLPQQVRRILRD